MDRISTLQEAHPFLTEDHARVLLVNCYMNVHQELRAMPPTLEKHALVQKCMDAEVEQFCNDTSTQIKNLLARAQEFFG